jgi:DNA-binding NtrC family response regulator
LLQTAFTDVATGEFRVLHKPFDPDTLVGAIRDAPDKRRA